MKFGNLFQKLFLSAVRKKTIEKPFFKFKAEGWELAKKIWSDRQFTIATNFFESSYKLRAAIWLRASFGNLLLHQNSSLFTVTFGEKVLNLGKAQYLHSESKEQFVKQNTVLTVPTSTYIGMIKRSRRKK